MNSRPQLFKREGAACTFNARRDGLGLDPCFCQQAQSAHFVERTLQVTLRRSPRLYAVRPSQKPVACHLLRSKRLAADLRSAESRTLHSAAAR